MDLASGLCTRCRGGSASSVLKNEVAMAIMVPELTWHAVASAPLEIRRRMECRVSGLIVNETEAEVCKDVTATESLIVGAQRFVGIRVW
jgi:hypothetical protein